MWQRDGLRVSLPRKERSGFFRDFRIFPEHPILTAEIDALFGRQAVGALAGVEIGLLNPFRSD